MGCAATPNLPFGKPRFFHGFFLSDLPSSSVADILNNDAGAGLATENAVQWKQ